jgi:hypothetical protein
MCVYNSRIFDAHLRDVVSLAVLADDHPNWRPAAYRRGLWGCSVGMTFPAAKLLDFQGRDAELEASHNPFAKVVLAHLKTLATRGDPGERRDWKLRIACGLHECGFGPEEIQELLKLVDWLMELPTALQRDYAKQLYEYEEGRHMPYYTGTARIIMLDMLEDLLRDKFGDEGVKLMPAIEALNDGEKYKALNRAIAAATTLDEVRQACAAASAPAPRGKKGGNRKRSRPRT